MTQSTAGRVGATDRSDALAQAFRRLSEAEPENQAGTDDVSSLYPLYEGVAAALSESVEALRALDTVPSGKRHPAVVLAALHYLALAGRAPVLAAAYAAGDGDAAARAAIDTVREKTDELAAVAVRHRLRPDETGRCPVLYPAIAEVARRAGADAVGLIDVNCSAGLNLNVDRVALTYDNDGRTLGDPSSPVRMAASVVGERPVPARAVPEVVARVGLDRDPLDVTDADDARWLRACLRPGQRERAARLEREMALAATAPPLLLRGDAVTALPDAVAPVPDGALPVALTTWALSRHSREKRQRFLHRLQEAAAHRPVAWVSVEGVGVAPTVPTFGDRPASGHSVIGVALFDGPHRRVEAVGRCWSRGRLLSWLAER
ncbi:DUF2332 domain-containing protein [Streptomyces sp. NPDC046939]|uniref:DUF2332 domain-containing protein n=1 Tax=Streptomyces sp. NPDC046939 TaxID=3155376 RepID=UPI0033CE9AC5